MFTHPFPPADLAQVTAPRQGMVTDQPGARGVAAGKSAADVLPISTAPLALSLCLGKREEALSSGSSTCPHLVTLPSGRQGGRWEGWGGRAKEIGCLTHQCAAAWWSSNLRQPVQGRKPGVYLQWEYRGVSTGDTPQQAWMLVFPSDPGQGGREGRKAGRQCLPSAACHIRICQSSHWPGWSSAPL